MQESEEKDILICHLFRSISENNKEQFEKLINEFKEFLPHSFNCINRNSDRKSLLTLFDHCLSRGRIHFVEKLFEFNNEYNVIEHENVEILRIAIRVNNVEMARRSVEYGADLEDVDYENLTPLGLALTYNNLEIVCMLLYYGGYPKYTEFYLSDFVLSMRLNSSEEIQMILMEYVTDFNCDLETDDESLLFVAISLKSPLILDLIERGANPSKIERNINGPINPPMYAIRYGYDVDTVRELWRLFDYNEWKHTSFSIAQIYPASVLCCSFPFFPDEYGNVEEYVEVFLDNEEKLMLDIEYHNSCRRSLVCDFYSACTSKNIDESFIHDSILHLLSCGASISYRDLHFIYSGSSNKDSSFFDILICMDIVEDRGAIWRPDTTFLYFKYTIQPSVRTFLKCYTFAFSDIEVPIVRDGLMRASAIFALHSRYSSFFQIIYANNRDIVSILENATYFPSLQQLAREASRKAIALKYGISRIGRFYALIRALDIPNYVKDLLTYRKNIYRIR